MRLLLDTQVLIWFLEDNKSLPGHIRDLISEADNEVLVCKISFFEVAIKLKIGGRLNLKRGLLGLINDCLLENISVLPLLDDHLLAYDRIPFYDDHRDPFDRLILATALAESIPIISADKKFQQYTGAVQLIYV